VHAAELKLGGDKGTSLACAGGVVCEEVVSTATPAPEDLELLSYYGRISP
jgi:hypothetical protein